MHPFELLKAAGRYVQKNPESVMKAAVDATALRFGIPIAALRWMASQSKPSKKAPKDIEVGSSPPALRLGATVDAMGTPVRASAAIRIDEVSFGPQSLRIGVRLTEVKLA